MNFNCFKYNELMVYLSQMIHGNGRITYVPENWGELLQFHPSQNSRFISLSFIRIEDTYKLNLETFMMHNDNYYFLIALSFRFVEGYTGSLKLG